MQLEGLLLDLLTVKQKKSKKFNRAIYGIPSGLDEETLSDHIQKFIPVSTKDYFLELIKGVLYKTGLIKIARELKRH